MLKTIAVKALLGAGALGVVGGSAALAGAPSLTANLAAATTPKATPNAARNVHRAGGTIIKLTDTEMTVERQRRDPSTRAVTKDDVTVELNSHTVVHFFGSKDKHGLEALKLGQDVGVRYTEINGQKVARGVVIRPDHRAGRIISKDADGKSFSIHAADGQTVHITTSEKTRFVEGLGKNKKSGSFADLKVGDRVVVLGPEDSQHNFDAAVVRTANRDAHPGSAATPAA